MDEKALVAQVVANDYEAIEELFIARCGTAIKFLSARFQYEELLGELYVHLCENDWRRLRTWQGRSSIKRWVEQVAIRICLHMKDFRPTEPLENYEDVLQAPEASPQRADITDVLEAIERLDVDRDRLVMRMLLIEKKELSEVALELAISPNNAYVIKCRAIKRLRDLLCLI